jgi:hypothetical protein
VAALTPQQSQLTYFLGRIEANILTAQDKAVLSAALTVVIADWKDWGPGPSAATQQLDETDAAAWIAPLYAIAAGTNSPP